MSFLAARSLTEVLASLFTNVVVFVISFGLYIFVGAGFLTLLSFIYSRLFQANSKEKLGGTSGAWAAWVLCAAWVVWSTWFK
jgi:hypothetical protein